MPRRRKAVLTVRENEALPRGVSFRATSTTPGPSRKTVDRAQVRSAQQRRLFNWSSRRVGSVHRKAFDARILAVRNRAAPSDLADETGTRDDLSRLLPEADVVVLACPLNDATRGMADARFFDRMKEGAILVNVARGGLVDDAALLAALDEGRVGTAVLDVFEPEPLPTSSPYWTHPNVRLTAHTSFAGDGVVPRGDELFLANLPRYLAGEPLINEVDLVAVLGG